MSLPPIWIVAFEFMPFPGGQATYAYEMARAFCALGHPVTVVVPAYPNADPAQDKAEPFHLERVLTHQKLNHTTLLAVMRALSAVPPEGIVLACDIRSGITTGIVRLYRRFRKIVMYHGGEIIRADYSRFAWIGNWVASWGAAKLLGNSNFSAGLVTKHLGRPCLGVPLGVAEYWLAPPQPATFESPVLAALPTDVPWVSTVARVARRKGHLGTIQALRAAQAAGPLPFLYVIAGKVIDQAYFAELEEEMRAMNGKVVYAGQISQNDVRLLYARSTLFMLAATYEKGDIEGFGLVITESGGQGCPAISTRVGGIADAVIDGKTGLLYEENDIGGMAQGIRKILTDKPYRDQLGQAAKAYAASLTWERNAKLTLEGVLKSAAFAFVPLLQVL